MGVWLGVCDTHWLRTGKAEGDSSYIQLRTRTPHNNNMLELLCLYDLYRER